MRQIVPEQETPNIMILVADDDFDTQKILHDFLTHHGYEVFVATNGNQALKLAEAFSPVLALVDVRMPGPSGISLTSQLKKVSPGIEVIIMTAYAKVEDAVDAMSQGAFYYLTKPLQMDELLGQVKRALAKAQTRLPTLRQLSGRRMQVLCLLAERKTNREIGEELGLVEKTIANYVSAILDILSVSNRRQAVLQARKLGLLDEES